MSFNKMEISIPELESGDDDDQINRASDSQIKENGVNLAVSESNSEIDIIVEIGTLGLEKSFDNTAGFLWGRRRARMLQQ